jgi:very-long-chain (3R)-3-hydroxyacyl-CoA dehydratase
MIVLIQIISRIFIVWGVANYIPHAQLTPGILLAVIAWSITEIIRYGYYALNLFQAAPQWLTWCRYSFFIVLYPLGVSGELTTIGKALMVLYPTTVRSRYSINLPNKLNFSLDYFYFLTLVVAAYLYFPTMYKHMFKQRAKTLHDPSTTKKKE